MTFPLFFPPYISIFIIFFRIHYFHGPFFFFLFFVSFFPLSPFFSYFVYFISTFFFFFFVYFISFFYFSCLFTLFLPFIFLLVLSTLFLHFFFLLHSLFFIPLLLHLFPFFIFFFPYFLFPHFSLCIYSFFVEAELIYRLLILDDFQFTLALFIKIEILLCFLNCHENMQLLKQHQPKKYYNKNVLLNSKAV